MVLQNRIAPNTTFLGNMEAIPKVSPPTPFLRINDGWAEGTFQSGFVEGPVRFLIGVRDGLSKSLEYHAGAIQLQGGGVIELQDVRFELTHEGTLLVRDRQSGTRLWSSPEARSSATNHETSPSRLVLSRKNGRLQIVRGDSVVWDPAIYLGRCGYTSTKGDPVLALSISPPYLQVKDEGTILYASQTRWKHFDLSADDFIAIPPDQATKQDSGGPPPIPLDSRPTSLREALSKFHLSDRSAEQGSRHPSTDAGRTIFLYLDPKTSQLLLHRSVNPKRFEEQDVLWRSPNWKTPKSDNSNRSKATLQR